MLIIFSCTIEGPVEFFNIIIPASVQSGGQSNAKEYEIKSKIVQERNMA